MQHGGGAALFPFADAIVESQQMGEALWVLEGRTLTLHALRKREKRAQLVQTPLLTPHQVAHARPLICTESPGPGGVSRGGENS